MPARLMVDLRNRLVMPNRTPERSCYRGGYVQITQISTDGFPGYPEAVDLAFGPYAKYGQIIKDYRNADQPGRYAPPEMVGTERKRVFGMSEGEERTICTSHVERHNLTIRTLMKRFTRLSLGFSKKLENLEAAVAMFLAYYNFVWRTRRPEKSGRYRVPAAVAAGVIPTFGRSMTYLTTLCQFERQITMSQDNTQSAREIPFNHHPVEIRIAGHEPFRVMAILGPEQDADDGLCTQLLNIDFSDAG